VLRTAALVGIVVAACGPDRGPPRPRPLPRVDSSLALRGGGAPRSSRIASYKIEARLDPVRHQVAASETLTWTNPGQTAVDVLPFHLYLNGFKNEQSLFMRSSRGELRGARASDTGWGYQTIESVRVAGADLTAKLRPPAGAGTDESVVELPLAEPVAPGATIEVEWKFTAQLPEVFARTGWKGEFHMVGQWFPKIGVRVGAPGAERWECQPFHANTEFFADFGTYDVELTVPTTHTVAATGVLTKAVDAGHGLRTLTYHAEDVHDFAWMADPYMEVMSGQAKLADGSVEVRVYYRPEQRHFARRHLQAGIGAIEKFSAMFVPYPWSIMSVIDPPVDAVGGAGGMEYPTLVTTAGDSVFARPGVRFPEFVTVHEVGHNWFQGILASNEAEEAWLDEGVNEWADARVMAELYGPRASGIDWAGWQAEYGALTRAGAAARPADRPSPIATAAYAFVDNTAYGEATYIETGGALTTLERTVGSQRFAAAMKAYTKAFAFHHPTGRDLFDTLAAELGQDLSWFFGPVFHDPGGFELTLRHAGCKPAHPPRGVFGEGGARKTVTEVEAPSAGTWSCEVVVQNTGRIHIPVDIELRFADGSSKLVRWDDRGTGTWERFTVDRSSRLAEVWIDPESKLALDNPTSHHFRIDGDGAASLRAGAWYGSLAQTLMQIVGP